MAKTVVYDEIAKFFENYEFTDDEIEISPAETVINIEKFVKSHLEIIKNNREKPVDTRRRLTPYWNRLLYMYKLLNLDWDKT